MCGGTSRTTYRKEGIQGLSPRVRGNRLHANDGREQNRSIPACAGEPSGLSGSSSGGGVYPRVCGGTQRNPDVGYQWWGLSPRVRGNLILWSPHSIRAGSIPACAGEPYNQYRSPIEDAVYPRVCGGTTSAGGSQTGGMGLSPRVRGNRQGGPYRRGEARSIPACAGEPGRRRAPSAVGRVYPRVCGGTRTGALNTFRV